MSSASDERKPGKMILVGFDHSQILERRFKAAGYDVLTVRDGMAAIDHARREPWDAAVLVSTGSLVNVADTAFNLRDLNRSMENYHSRKPLGPALQPLSSATPGASNRAHSRLDAPSTAKGINRLFSTPATQRDSIKLFVSSLPRSFSHRQYLGTD